MFAQRVHAHLHAALLVLVALVEQGELSVEVVRVGAVFRIARGDGAGQRGAHTLQLGRQRFGGGGRAHGLLGRPRPQRRDGRVCRAQRDGVGHVQPLTESLGQVLPGRVGQGGRALGQKARELSHQGRAVEIAAHENGPSRPLRGAAFEWV